MKKMIKPKRLTLGQETLRKLSNDSLRRAGGALMYIATLYPCNSAPGCITAANACTYAWTCDYTVGSECFSEGGNGCTY